MSHSPCVKDERRRGAHSTVEMLSNKSCLGGIFSTGKSRATSVPGLILVEQAMSSEEEKSLLEAADESSVRWARRRTRITKNYGPYYLFTERDTPHGRFRFTDGKVVHTPLPPFLYSLVLPIVRRAVPLLQDFEPNQVHIALYRKGEDGKIRMHNDNKMGELGPYIVGMCLVSDCDMTFVRPRDGRKRVVHLPRRCVYVMTGESHTEWRHGILSGQTPGDRVSFTLRDVRNLAVEGDAKVTKSSHVPSERALAMQRQKDSDKLEGRQCELNISLLETISADIE